MNEAPQPTKKPRTIQTVGALLAILLVLSAILYLLRDSLPTTNLINLGERAFGELSVDQAATEAALSGRGGGSATSDSKLSYPVGDEFLYPEYSEKYEYLYEGTLPDLSTFDATVYRRANDFTLSSSLSSAFANLNTGIVPFSTFNDLNLVYFSVEEEGGNGYSIYVDTHANTISISRGTEYWRQVDYTQTLSASDIPTDTQLIQIANQFLNEHNIDTSAFGEPTVDRSYIDAESWVPDTMNVVYPYLVNGAPVWSMWGSPSGMSVSVSLRSDSVESLYTTGPSSIEASTYELASDPNEILEVATRGGLWEYTPENPTVTYTFTLGEPELILAEHYQYLENGTSSTLYVPAFRFPVTQADPDAPYQRDWVIVPLVQDILDEAAPSGPILFEETVDADINIKR